MTTMKGSKVIINTTISQDEYNEAKQNHLLFNDLISAGLRYPLKVKELNETIEQQKEAIERMQQNMQKLIKERLELQGRIETLEGIGR